MPHPLHYRDEDLRRICQSIELLRIRTDDEMLMLQTAIFKATDANTTGLREAKNMLSDVIGDLYTTPLSDAEKEEDERCERNARAYRDALEA